MRGREAQREREREKYLAKSVFSGEVREATDKEGAVRVADELGITEGIICKGEKKGKLEMSEKF